MASYPIHAAGDVCDLPGLGKLACVIPIGNEPPPTTGPTPPNPSGMDPTSETSVFGYESEVAFTLGNDAADIIAGAVYVSDGGISGLELSFFGRDPLKAGGSLGDRIGFSLRHDEEIIGIEGKVISCRCLHQCTYAPDILGTTNGKHLTSLSLLTNQRRLDHGSPGENAFSWYATEKQTIVGLSGFAGNFINGLAAIYLDTTDEPPYDPLKDVDVEFLPGCSILPPEIQRLVHNSDHTSLNERQTKYNQNMKTVYGSIAATMRDEKNPWGQYTHLESGKHILIHADDQSQSYVYIFSNNQDAVPTPGNRLSATIGHYSGQGGWFDSYSYIIRGAVDFTAGIATMWALGRWMSRSLLNQAEVFTINALNTLTQQLVVRNVMTAANGRVFARVATNVFRKTFKYGVKALKVGIALLIAWSVDELISYIFKTYFVTIRIFNYDARLVEWIPDSYYGYNETVANGKWSVETIPKVLNIGEKKWMPGLGWVGPDDYVGHYNSYTWSNDSYGAGVAIAMTVKRPGTSESINFMYRVPKAEDNSMGLDWGNQGNQEYLNSGRDTKVKQLSINSPIKVSGTSPALGGEANNSYSYTITIGTLPPPKG